MTGIAKFFHIFAYTVPVSQGPETDTNLGQVVHEGLLLKELQSKLQ